jgi:hypothetical protein
VLTQSEIAGLTLVASVPEPAMSLIFCAGILGAVVGHRKKSSMNPNKRRG